MEHLRVLKTDLPRDSVVVTISGLIHKDKPIIVEHAEQWVRENCPIINSPSVACKKKHFAMLWGGIRRQNPQLMCSGKLDLSLRRHTYKNSCVCCSKTKINNV